MGDRCRVRRSRRVQHRPGVLAAEAAMSDVMAETNGKVITLRCNLPGCPHPHIGTWLPEAYGPGVYECESDRHWFEQHVLPARLRQVTAEINAQPSSLEAHMPGISAVMAEHGLRFRWEKP
jgi:hypothetical protein